MITNTKHYAFIVLTCWKHCIVSHVLGAKAAAAGAIFSPLSGKDARTEISLQLPFYLRICPGNQFSGVNAHRQINIWIQFNQMPTYVAAAETCPLLVR